MIMTDAEAILSLGLVILIKYYFGSGYVVGRDYGRGLKEIQNLNTRYWQLHPGLFVDQG